MSLICMRHVTYSLSLSVALSLSCSLLRESLARGTVVALRAVHAGVGLVEILKSQLTAKFTM